MYYNKSQRIQLKKKTQTITQARNHMHNIQKLKLTLIKNGSVPLLRPTQRYDTAKRAQTHTYTQRKTKYHVENAGHQIISPDVGHA